LNSCSKIYTLIAVSVSLVLAGSNIPAFSQSNVSTAGDTNATFSTNVQGSLIPNILNDTSINRVPRSPPMILSPDTVPQINETVIVLNPRPPTTNATTFSITNFNTTNFNATTFNATTLDPNTRTRALLIYFDSVRIIDSHDDWEPAQWYLWAGVNIFPFQQEQERLWVPLIQEFNVFGGSHYQILYPKVIAVEAPEFSPPPQPAAITVLTQGFDDDCGGFPFEFCGLAPRPTPYVPSNGDYEVLGEVRWLGWNFQNWGMDSGSTYGQHTVPSVKTGPFGIKYADYEITFQVMDCGGPSCTVIDYDGNVRHLIPPALLY
jgi:hypothetical protein